MELYKVHTTILMPFVNQTLAALADMADLKATAGKGFAEDVAKFDSGGYAVCVAARTFGSIEGKVLMHHHDATALAIGNNVRGKMLGEPSNAAVINDEIGEALSEFANTVIGLATRELKKADLKLEFSPPLFVTGSEDIKYIMEGVQEILSIPIDVAGVGKFFFSYLLHKKTA